MALGAARRHGQEATRDEAQELRAFLEMRVAAPAAQGRCASPPVALFGRHRDG